MSRTHRCKNYLSEHGTTWDRAGCRQFGPYTEYDYISADGYWHGCRVWREPTKLELWKTKRAWFGESSTANARSPNRYFRNHRQRENRRMTAHELFKFSKFEDYEPMVEEEPRSCMWDWR